MQIIEKKPVLLEILAPEGDMAKLAARAFMVLAGIAALALAAKIRLPFWPVPVTMQTFVVLMVGAGYGARLGLVTLLGYVALGAAGVAVFAGDSAGLAYMAGPTGGYLVGFVAAVALMGALARRGWDRTPIRMALAMFLGTAVIYAFGLAWMSWLFAASKGIGWVLQYGMVNFLTGDALKLVLAAMIMPLAWKATGR